MHLRELLVRLNCDQRTKDYLAKRVSDGKSKTEAIRCLKRYIAREVFAARPRNRHRVLHRRLERTSPPFYLDQERRRDHHARQTITPPQEDLQPAALAHSVLHAVGAARGRSVDPNVYRAVANHPQALQALVQSAPSCTARTQ